MSETDSGRSDALVLFGATGDLASKMIFPALARLAEREELDLPVVAVGHRTLAEGELAARVRARLAVEAPALARPFERVAARLRYVNGDLRDAGVYAAIARSLGGARFPLHYLAVPPTLFAPVIEGLAAGGLARAARIAIEKPFGRDLESARALERTVGAAFPDEAVFRIDHYLAKDPVRNLADMRATSAWLEPLWSQQHVRSVQVTMAESFGIATRGAFYEATGVLRDVFQNHLLELVAIAAMEPVPPHDADAFAAARVDALRAIEPLAPDDVVYGQYEGYRAEPGVDPRSQVATYLAARLHVDTPRFAGVPFLVRSGKRLAVTSTLLSLSLGRVRPLHGPLPLPGEHLRFRLGPGHARIALDTRCLTPGPHRAHEPLTLDAALCDDEDRDAYVNILYALVHGDHGISERAAGVAAAWRVVEDVVHASVPVHAYAPGSLGPREADRLLRPGESWLDPVEA
jgi:glucose-6-phosphate 1-dehydrogenase